MFGNVVLETLFVFFENINENMCENMCNFV